MQVETMMPAPIRVLFLSDGNAARSQMAVALLRQLGSAGFEGCSTGFEPEPLHPMAVRAMAEEGVDISGQLIKPLSDYLDTQFDHVITLCGRARHYCPGFPYDNETLRWTCEDPAAAQGDETARYATFRGARDKPRNQIEHWLASQGFRWSD
jgi:arsenate reductase